MKKLISLLLVFILVMSSCTFAFAGTTDTPSSEIGKFLSGKVNMALFASMCVKYYGLEDVTPAPNTFKDVPDNNAAQDILRLVAIGVIKGYGNGTLGYKESVAEGRAGVIISRLEAYKNPAQFEAAPDVKTEMNTADYWISLAKDPDRVILSPAEIDKLNQEIIAAEGANVTDLEKVSTQFNGSELKKSLASFTTPSSKHWINGVLADEAYYEAIRKNIKSAGSRSDMNVSYGIITERTYIKAYPYEGFLSDDPADTEWDDFASTGLYVNEPVLVYLYTYDKKFAYVKSDTTTGWIPASDVAIAADRAQWLSAKNFDDKLVVTGEKVYLEASGDPDVSEKMLTMGTILKLSEEAGPVDERAEWYNYKVYLPTRAADGSLVLKTAFISASRDVHIGYLDYTVRNVIELSMKHLGNRYGWGGMMNSQDCSGYAREVYRCLGINLARNTTWQAAMPCDITEFGEMSVIARASVLDKTLPGSILQFPGHEMIYLGKSDGNYYVISAVSNIMNPDDPAKRLRTRCVQINTLEIKRGSGATWLEALTRVITVK